MAWDPDKSAFTLGQKPVCPNLTVQQAALADRPRLTFCHYSSLRSDSRKVPVPWDLLCKMLLFCRQKRCRGSDEMWSAFLHRASAEQKKRWGMVVGSNEKECHSKYINRRVWLCKLRTWLGFCHGAGTDEANGLEWSTASPAAATMGRHRSAWPPRLIVDTPLREQLALRQGALRVPVTEQRIEIRKKKK